MIKFMIFFLIATFLLSISFSQDLQMSNPKQKVLKSNPTHPDKKTGIFGTGSQHPIRMKSHDPNFRRTSASSFYKRKSEWQAIIDSTWGPGLPLAEKLKVFDYYASYVRAHNPTFGCTKLNWDSVAASWRSQITDSTSCGGFSAILSYLAYQLNDGAQSWGCDLIMFETPLNPGTPIIVGLPFDYGDLGVSHFGAGLTPLPDSSLLVYMVTPNHPLGLEPGDIVLGYEGVPWHSLIRDLIAAEIPIVAYTGGCPSAAEFYLLQCAGMNWHLFDTIDIAKYTTGDTLHLPTDTLLGLNITTQVVNGAQLPVPGVPMPGWKVIGDNITSPAVSYGIIEDTNIGYIYVYHHQNDNAGSLFNAAVTALSQTDGLIIDIRFDNGGWSGLRTGIARLTNYAGPTLVFRVRSSPEDLWALIPRSIKELDYTLPQDGLIYDHPIAVLTGPTCLSYGDITARQLRYVENIRFFGKSPMAAYALKWDGVYPQPFYSGFILECSVGTEVDHRFPDEPLFGREFPIDEDVWLTRDDVAKGEDTVVKRALEWIQNLAYAHDVSVDQTFIRPNQDTVTISAIVENPNHHPLTVLATLLNDSNAVIDSVYLHDDGLHHDSHSGDNIWANSYFSNSSIEQTVRVSVSSDDPVAGDQRCLPNVTAFTSIGPLVLEGTRNTSTDQEINAGDYIQFKFTLRNESSSATAINVTSCVVPLDTCASITNVTKCTFGDLAPGASVEGGGSQYIRFNKNCPGQTARFALEIYSDIYHLWSDTFALDIVSGLEDGTDDIITTYDLCQNYPNPFNPKTMIEYSVGAHGNAPVHVELSIYNLFGQKVATLVSAKQPAGRYNVQWDATGFSSGVYFYRLETKGYVETKKLILMK